MHSDEQLVRVYDSMARRHAGDRLEDITREMRSLLAASTDAEAGALLDWWGCWEEDGEAERWAAGYRARFGVGDEFDHRCHELAAEARGWSAGRVDPVLFARLILHEYAGGVDPRLAEEI
jgi:hypothetical protein